MPFVPPAMTGLMMAKAATLSMMGEKTFPLVSSVATASCQYLMMAPIVMTTNFVVGPGAGVYTGTVVGVVPDAMSAMMMVQAASYGLLGRDTKKLFDAVSFGVCNSVMSTTLSQGSVIGGGPGAGQGKIINLVPTVLQGLIMAQMAMKTMVGEKTMQIISSIAFGICMHIMSAATVVTTCIGAFTPPPVGPIPIPAAPGPGRLM